MNLRVPPCWISEVGVGVGDAVGWVVVGWVAVGVVTVGVGVVVCVGWVAVGVEVGVGSPQAGNRRMNIRNIARGKSSFFIVLPPFYLSM
jgi:hypothetical protein